MEAAVEDFDQREPRRTPPGTDVEGSEEQLMQKLLAQPVLQGSYMAFVNSRELQGLPSVSPDKPVTNFVVGRFEHHADAVAWLNERSV